MEMELRNVDLSVGSGLRVVSAFRKESHDGEGAEIMFANGHGASIVRHSGSYGGTQGLFELAVLDADGSIDYSTPITSDVRGWLSVPEVIDLLRQIDALPPVLAVRPS